MIATRDTRIQFSALPRVIPRVISRVIPPREPEVGSALGQDAARWNHLISVLL